MRAVRHAVRLAVLLLPAALLPACTIASIDGAGPQPRSAFADRLDDVDPNEILEWKRDLLNDPDSGTDRGVGAAKGYTLTADLGSPWPLLVGKSNYDIHYQPPTSAAKREIWGFVDATGLLAPFGYLSWDSRYLDVETGRCVGTYQLVSLTPLVAWSETAATPGMDTGLAQDVVDANTPLDTLRFDGETSFDLGLGVLGFGSRNGVGFLKLLWVQIPLGSGE